MKSCRTSSRIHLVGAGGAGMLPLAIILKQAGNSVSGGKTVLANDEGIVEMEGKETLEKKEDKEVSVYNH